MDSASAWAGSDLDSPSGRSDLSPIRDNGGDSVNGVVNHSPAV